VLHNGHNEVTTDTTGPGRLRIDAAGVNRTPKANALILEAAEDGMDQTASPVPPCSL